MPLLTELGRAGRAWFYKEVAPTGLGPPSFPLRLENVPRIVGDAELLQQLHVFLEKSFLRMMLLLVLDVADDGVELRAGIGESAKALLPGKPAGHPSLAFDETRRAGLDVANQIRQHQIRLQPNEQVNVVGHVINCNELLSLPRNNARDVFLELVVVLRANEILSAFDGEDDMDIDLRVGVGHARKMPLLTELGQTQNSLLQRCRP